MIKNLENKMEKMQESINKDLEELKSKHTKTNNTITEIKNTLEGINRFGIKKSINFSINRKINNQDYCTGIGSHSKLMEKSKAIQISKSLREFSTTKPALQQKLKGLI